MAETESLGEIARPPETLTINLAKPVTLGDLSWSQLVLREPTGAEMIAVDTKKGWALEVSLISLISGVPEPAVIKIGVRDLTEARKYIGNFFA